MDDARRVQRLETEIATLRADVEHHGKLCEARWHVAWKLAALVGAVIALIVSAAIAIWQQS